MTNLDRIACQNRWRRRAPLEKVSLAIGLLIIALALPTPLMTGTVFALITILTLAGARVPFGVWLKALLMPLLFAAMGAASLLFRFESGFIFAPEGVEQALAVFLRTLAGFGCLLFLVLTTPATDLVAAGRRLGLSAEVADVMLLTYRFIVLLGDVALTMRAAQGARLGYSTTPRRAIVSVGMGAAALLPRALEKGKRLETGLAARGWNGECRLLLSAQKLSLPVLIGILALEGALVVLGTWGLGT